MKLITQNTLGKTDYVGTLEFFRSSPAILEAVPDPELRDKIIMIGSLLADRSPQEAIEFLSESPQLLHQLPSAAWQLRVLQYAGLLADQDPGSALAYMRRCPEFLSLAGPTEDTQEAFQKWFAAGMEILEYSAEGARAYFALETRQALASLEQAMSAVPLRQVVRSLALFGQMICGESIRIEPVLPPTSVTDRPVAQSLRSQFAGKDASVMGDQNTVKYTVYLPDIVNQYPTRDANLRLYTVMTAHQLGHLEFGTYRLNFSILEECFWDVRARYGLSGDAHGAFSTLTNLFDCYPQKGVIQDLWAVLETGRIECRLQSEYPGLKRDFLDLAKSTLETRSFLHGMTAREMVIDALLLRLRTREADSLVLQDDLVPIIEKAWHEAKMVLSLDCTAEEVIMVADRVYRLLDEMIGTLCLDGVPPSEASSEDETSDLGAGPRASEETSGAYRPITNWAYRGTTHPEWVKGDTEVTERHSSDGGDPAGSSSLGHETPGMVFDHEASGTPHSRFPLEEQPDSLDREQGRSIERMSNHAGLFYDEWDGTIHDYRPKWCRIVERSGPEGAGDFPQSVLATRGATISAPSAIF